MSDKHYQLVLLGPEKNTYKDAVQGQIETLFAAIGLDFATDGEFLIGGATTPDWSGFPVAVWFGGIGITREAEHRLMGEFLNRGFTLIPVVADLVGYSKLVPAELKPINGQQFELARICADIMRGFRLARALRQVFISYKRSESSGVAHQLFHELNERGFRVFLDTASVDAGTNFQKALWSRMVDVDLVILLDTKNALNSSWVHQELNRAHDLGLGVVQLIWPHHTQTPGTELSFPICLKESDFINGLGDTGDMLQDTVINQAIRSIESERIRSLSARRTRLVEGLLDYVNTKGAKVYVHPMQNVDVLKGSKKIVEIVPFVGVPDSLSLFQQELAIAHDPTIIVYNGLGVDEEWALHLKWLNTKAKIAVYQIDDFGTYIGSLV